MEPIKVETIKSPQVDVIKFQGILDNQVKTRLEEVFASISQTVILDFTQAERINSMGITVLLKVLRDFANQGGKVYYVHLTRLNTKLFRMVGLTKLGKIFENMDDTLRYLSRPK